MSDNQITAMLEMLRGNFGKMIQAGAELPANVKVADARMNERSGVNINRLDGCIKCNEHVWAQSNKGAICPVAGCQGKRYDSQGHALEQVIHFPLKPRLEALLRDSAAFREAVNYERTRPRVKDEDLIAGVFALV